MRRVPLLPVGQGQDCAPEALSVYSVSPGSQLPLWWLVCMVCLCGLTLADRRVDGHSWSGIQAVDREKAHAARGFRQLNLIRALSSHPGDGNESTQNAGLNHRGIM